MYKEDNTHNSAMKGYEMDIPECAVWSDELNCWIVPDEWFQEHITDVSEEIAQFIIDTCNTL